MPETDIPYELVGPDGTRVVFNNPADPDYVGRLDPGDGIAFGGDVRDSYFDHVEQDGGFDGPGFAGRLSVALKGLIEPEIDATVLYSYEQRIKRASRALRADARLRWTPTGQPQRELLLRRTAYPAIGERRPKRFQLALAAADPYPRAPAESSVTVDPAVTPGAGGLASALGSPLQTTQTRPRGSITVTNAGDADAWARFRVDGYVRDPVIWNVRTDERVQLGIEVPSGFWLDIRPERGSVLLNGQSKRWNAYDFAASNWWKLPPGDSELRFLPAAAGGGALLTVYHRPAWEA